LTAATLRLVEGLVQVTALGPVPVKGLEEPIEVLELVGASGLRRRLQATAMRGLTRFVGRDRELDALHQGLERAGAGPAILILALPWIRNCLWRSIVFKVGLPLTTRRPRCPGP